MKDFTKMFKKEATCDYPLGSKECGEFLRSTYSHSVDKVCNLDDSLYEDILEYDIIVDEIKNLEAMKRAIEHKIQGELKFCESGFCKSRKVSWKKVSRSTFDSKMLKAQMPEVYGRFVKVSSSRVFKIK